MTRPTDTIAGCLGAHQRLRDDLVDLDDATARQPSLLPGWSVGHLVTHLARNADSVARRLAGAGRDEIVDQYPGGAAGRAAEIEAGADRPAADIVGDLVAAQSALEAAFDALPDEAWDRPGRDVRGVESPVRGLPLVRWREVAIHHVDLGLGYSPADWPTELVDLVLPDVLPTLVDRADRRALLAWVIRRGAAPELEPWR